MRDRPHCRHNSTAKKSYSRQNNTALKVLVVYQELMSLFATLAPVRVFLLNSNTRLSAVTDLNPSAAAEQEAVFFARESFLGELKTLNRDHPTTGFGISLRTHSGEHYLLANARMPLPAAKSEGFPTGRRVACLENGDRFSSIEVLADSKSYETISPRAEAEILGNALDLIARIDTLTSVPAGRVAHEPQIAATGTGG
ncbi:MULTISPECIES: hypothetical protein [Ruegeria]|uniref:hypothetical protein n=1 Tax=Ruegeria TaxID=97050 RepID=UPI0012A9985A|nr:MULTISPECIES: hypothetical protein [Ruegeria]QFT75166.1 hypothetical protein FIU92_19155 [Ruegeria sp. THAF33]